MAKHAEKPSTANALSQEVTQAKKAPNAKIKIVKPTEFAKMRSALRTSEG